MYAAFREMCSTKNEGMYLKLLPQLTEEFRTVSEGVMACEKRLLSQGQFDLAKTIRLIQDQERTKLQATISLQALQKAYAFETLPWQNGDEAAWSEPTASRLTGDFCEARHDGNVDIGLHAHLCMLILALCQGIQPVPSLQVNTRMASIVAATKTTVEAL